MTGVSSAGRHLNECEFASKKIANMLWSTRITDKACKVQFKVWVGK